MAITKHDDGFFAKIIHYKYTTFIFYNEQNLVFLYFYLL